MKVWSALALAGAVLVGGPGSAAAQQPEGGGSQFCTRYDGRQEAKDAKRVVAAEQAFKRGGFPALSRQVRALEDVLAHAPKDFQAQQDCKFQAALLQGLASASRQPTRNRTVTLDAGLLNSPYPRASLLLGSHAVESGDYARAAASLMKGVEMKPDDPMLASEAATALARTGRLDQALTVLQRALGDELEPLDRARLLRTRGFTLIELNRLDEAEQAYRQSLDSEPGHGGAANQLTYIAEVRAGAPTVAPGVTSSETFRRPNP